VSRPRLVLGMQMEYVSGAGTHNNVQPLVANSNMPY